jgi:O-antigen ligase
MIERLTFNHGIALPGSRVRLAAPLVEPDADMHARPAFKPVEGRADAAFWGVFLFTGLLFFRPQDSVPGLAALHLSEAAAALALVAMVVVRVRAGAPLVPCPPELAGVAGLAAVMLATAPFSIWPGGALAVFQDVYLKVALVFLLLVHSLKSPRLVRRLSWLIVLAMGYVALHGVFDYVRGVNLVKGGRLQGPIDGLMGNPNDLAMNMVTFLPLAIVFALSRGRPAARWLAAGISLLMIATIAFTKSRAGVLGLLTTFVVLIALSSRYRIRIAAVVLVGTLVGVPLAPESLRARVSSIVNQEEDETGSRQARKDLMWDAWQTLLERPLTGVGAGQFKNYNPPERLEPWRETHNVLLQVLVELGIAGGLVFVCLIAAAAVALVQTNRRIPSEASGRSPRWPASIAFRADEAEWMRSHVVALSAALAGWVVCAQFASVGYYWTFYYLLGLVVAGREVVRDRMAAVARTAGGPPAVRAPRSP